MWPCTLVSLSIGLNTFISLEGGTSVSGRNTGEWDINACLSIPTAKPLYMSSASFLFLRMAAFIELGPLDSFWSALCSGPMHGCLLMSKTHCGSVSLSIGFNACRCMFLFCQLQLHNLPTLKFASHSLKNCALEQFSLFFGIFNCARLCNVIFAATLNRMQLQFSITFKMFYNMCKSIWRQPL